MKVITCNEMIAHSTPVFDSLRILRLNDVFQLQLASSVYECVNNLSPLYFRKLQATFFGGQKKLKITQNWACGKLHLNKT